VSYDQYIIQQHKQVREYVKGGQGGTVFADPAFARGMQTGIYWLQNNLALIISSHCTQCSAQSST
jgi:hypothetical protein